MVQYNYKINPELLTSENVVDLDFYNNIIHLKYLVVNKKDYVKISYHNDMIDNHLIQYEDLKKKILISKFNRIFF